MLAKQRPGEDEPAGDAVHGIDVVVVAVGGELIDRVLVTKIEFQRSPSHESGRVVVIGAEIFDVGGHRASHCRRARSETVHSERIGVGPSRAQYEREYGGADEMGAHAQNDTVAARPIR